MPGDSPATDFSVALLGHLIALGVNDIVLCPGSRSQAVALAAAEYERAGRVRLRVRIDERSAGFLALGLALETRSPVVVITTSGTAVANLHPAVLEAHHSGVPLILITADRPVELRGIGSNQTTVQPGLFGAAVGFVRDVEAPTGVEAGHELAAEVAREAFSAASGHSATATASAGAKENTGGAGRAASVPGPVQLNLAFREPLSAAVDPGDLLPESTSEGGVALAATPPPLGFEPRSLAEVDGTVVIAGHGAGPRAEQLARELGAPLIAEVSSGSRFGPNLVVAYRQLLREGEFGGLVRRAIVFGHPTLTREVPALLQRSDVEVIVVPGPGAEPYNPGHRAEVTAAVSFDGKPMERAWAGRWVAASRSLLERAESVATADRTGDDSAVAEFTRAQLAVFREPVTRRMLTNAVWRATWPHDRLIFGASRLIRDADSVLPGKRISVHANRGLAGIDGTIATATGIALAAEANGMTGTTRVLIGDLTLLHDVGSMLFGSGEPRPRLQVVVGNDGGGTIFDGLEVGSTAPRESMDRVLYTPHSVELRALAAAYGWAYLRVGNRGELDEALAPPTGPILIEVVLPR